MTSDHVEFRDGQVVSPGVTWVYVWIRDGAVARIGSTWLHPAARAAKHVRDGEAPQGAIRAFRVPGSLERSRIRDGLGYVLAQAGALSASYAGRAGTEPVELTPEEQSFVDACIADLPLARGAG